MHPRNSAAIAVTTRCAGRPRRRKPTSPGEILREEFLVPLGLSQKVLADHLGCDAKVVNRIVNGRCAVTAEMALRLGAAFRTSPGCAEGRRSLRGRRAGSEPAETSPEGELRPSARGASSGDEGP